MNNTKIDWCDMSWNPITGCKHGCTYCYARRIAERFGGAETTCATGELHTLNEPFYDDPAFWIAKDGESRRRPFPFMFDPTFHRYRLEEPSRKKRPRNIFVGSTADVFGSWVPAKWIADVIDACRAGPQHNYLFLTKNPRRYAELDHLALLPREKNFWYGTSITGPEQTFFCSNLHKTFLSIEPLLEPLGKAGDTGLPSADWVIIGAMTGSGAKEHQPQRAWVEEIVKECRGRSVPVFMKNNLAEVWGAELIREFPPELRKQEG